MCFYLSQTFFYSQVAETLLEQSCSKFFEAVKIKNTEFDILYNYGNALLWLAQLQIHSKKDLTNAIELLDQSCNYFEQASALRYVIEDVSAYR